MISVHTKNDVAIGIFLGMISTKRKSLSYETNSLYVYKIEQYNIWNIIKICKSFAPVLQDNIYTMCGDGARGG